MNAFNHSRQSEIFVVGQSVITLRPDRHMPPTEYDLIRDELQRITESKSRRRRSRRSAGAR